MAKPKPIRAVVTEFATIALGEDRLMQMVVEDTLHLQLRAQVLNEDGETVEYLSDAIPFHLVSKPKDAP